MFYRSRLFGVASCLPPKALDFTLVEDGEWEGLVAELKGFFLMVGLLIAGVAAAIVPWIILLWFIHYVGTR